MYDINLYLRGTVTSVGITVFAGYCDTGRRHCICRDVTLQTVTLQTVSPQTGCGQVSTKVENCSLTMCAESRASRSPEEIDGSIEPVGSLAEGVRCAPQTPMGSATPSKTCGFLQVMEKQKFLRYRRTSSANARNSDCFAPLI
jgi:hypothetical protein